MNSSNGFSFDQMVQQAANSLDPLRDLLGIFCFIAGVMMAISALYSAVHLGDDAHKKNASWVSVVIRFAIACVLIGLPTAMQTTWQTAFGSSSIMAYSGLAVSASSGIFAKADATIRAVLQFIQFFGWLAFVRGWFILKAHFEGQNARIGAGATHIIGGALAANAVAFISVMEATLGVKLLTGA
jgi:hypothetical protein